MTGPAEPASRVEILLTDDDVAAARTIASERLSDPARHQSAHRPTARNPASQFRGAAGEIAAVRWLTAEGLMVDDEGYREDAGRADLTVSGQPVEVMTAKMADREKTGFCVPPKKLAAARARGAWGYLFVGTGGEVEPRTLTMQAACRIDDVDLDDVRDTYVSSPRYAVPNFVVRADALISPTDFLRAMRLNP